MDDIATILSQIDLGSLALPEFQRGYVWNRDQVRKLMQAVYRRYPIGSLLVWLTQTDTAAARGNAPLKSGSVELLLDGQQRITSLYGIIRGKPPKFFDGDANAFTGLYFNVEEEIFEFYARQKMQGNPLWISVTELMQAQGLTTIIQRLMQVSNLAPFIGVYVERLGQLHAIQKIGLHIEKVAGDDKTVDVVVDIFNQVNSGGTKLSKGDLTLAKVCAGWPAARQEMKATLARWQAAGFDFELDWLLRNITTIITGDAQFASLKDTSAATFQGGLQRAEAACNTLLNVISGRLGLDHDRVLGSRYAFPVMSRYLDQRGGKFQNALERDKLLYWYIHSFLWGRFAGSTESFINLDLRALEGSEDPLDRLIDQLRRSRGTLEIRAQDFESWSVGSRFYPLLYLLTRVYQAQDWGNGQPLSANILGKNNALQVHHIFPKSLLYAAGYGRAEVNAVANFCFLTADTNLDISNKNPAVYLDDIRQHYLGALESQWMPMDPALWQIDRYRDFLVARRDILAHAANTFLNSLLHGSMPDAKVTTPVLDRPIEVTPSMAPQDEVEQELNTWITTQGFVAGQVLYELAHPQTGDVLGILDLAWPKGLRGDLGDPVAFLPGDDDDVKVAASIAGYRCFTSADALRKYVQEAVDGANPRLQEVSS